MLKTLCFLKKKGKKSEFRTGSFHFPAPSRTARCIQTGSCPALPCRESHLLRVRLPAVPPKALTGRSTGPPNAGRPGLGLVGPIRRLSLALLPLLSSFVHSKPTNLLAFHCCWLASIVTRPSVSLIASLGTTQLLFDEQQPHRTYGRYRGNNELMD